MAARTRKINHDDKTRDKIRASNIVHRMLSCIDGEVMLDAQQVSCAKALLNKILPDLSNVALTGEDNTGPVKFQVEWLASKGE
jgi:hypothetical protein